jgi:hypothetical protein
VKFFLIYFVAASKKQGSQTDLDECIVTEHWTLNTAGKNWAKPRRYSSTVSTPVAVFCGRRDKKSLKSQITATRRNFNGAAKEKFARLLKVGNWKSKAHVYLEQLPF